MKKDRLLPQGVFRIGRDLDAGVYLVAGLNDLSFVNVKKSKDEPMDSYTLNEDNAKIVHIALENGNILNIDGKVKVRKIKSIHEESSSIDLFEEIEKFEKSLKLTSEKVETSSFQPMRYNIEEEKEDLTEEIDEETVEEEADEEIIEEQKPQKVGFWKGLSMLFSTPTTSTPSSDTSDNYWGSMKKKDTGRCDGDCANCPPHYGYRYGRWYYGHDHSEGCTRGGNRNGGGF